VWRCACQVTAVIHASTLTTRTRASIRSSRISTCWSFRGRAAQVDCIDGLRRFRRVFAGWQADRFFLQSVGIEGTLGVRCRWRQCGPDYALRRAGGGNSALVAGWAADRLRRASRRKRRCFRGWRGRQWTAATDRRAGRRRAPRVVAGWYEVGRQRKDLAVDPSIRMHSPDGTVGIHRDGKRAVRVGGGGSGAALFLRAVLAVRGR